MKAFTLLISLLLFAGIANDAAAQDTIYWSPNYKLTWDDFKGEMDSTSQFGATSFVGIKYSLSANEDSFDVKVLCYFIESRSWVRVISKIGLIHEQGHFDIAELFARKLRKAFAEYKFKYINIKQDFSNLYSQIRKERTAMDDLYDKETDFSRNKLKQQLWNKKIKEELDKLKIYASSYN